MAVAAVVVIVMVHVTCSDQSRDKESPQEEWKEIDTKKALLRETRVDGMLLLSLGFTPDGKYICVSSSKHFDRGGLEFYNPANLEMECRIPAICGDLLEMSRDSRYVAVGQMNSVWIVDVASKKIVRELNPIAVGFHKVEYPSALAISPDGKLVALSGMRPSVHPDYTIRHMMAVWDTQSGELVEKIDFDGEQHLGISMGGLAFSPDGTMLAGGLASGGAVVIWDSSDFHVLKELSYRDQEWQTPRMGLRPRWIGNGTGLVVRGDNIQPRKGKKIDYPIDIWDFDKGTLVSRTPSPVSGREAISPDNRYIACCSGGYGTTHILSMTTGKRLGCILYHVYDGVDRAFSPDGKLLVSGEEGAGSLCVWDWQEILRQLGEAK
ncbi:MAG: hypothetical protein RDV41_05540 [Planctomycetota bacterium]|nr:hypothetical protein [Planctomycetota bacterium]